MSRSLYLYNVETGERAGCVDVSEMKPGDIIALENRMWTQIDDPWVVRDTDNDDHRIARPPLQRPKKSPTSPI